MGRYLVGAHVFSTDVVAVVDNCLRAVYEVARCLPLPLVCISFCGGVIVVKSGDGSRIQGRQGGVDMIGFRTFTMDVLRIDETTTDTRLHIDQVEFDDTGNRAPHLLIEFLAGALLRGQFQIDT